MFALACTLTASADAVTFEKDGLKYEVTSPTTVRVAENKIAGVTVNVPANVENNGTTYTVNSIGEEAFKWDDVINVTLPAFTSSSCCRPAICRPRFCAPATRLPSTSSAA